MVNWVIRAVDGVHEEIDREARVINYEAQAARYASKHRQDLLSEFGRDAVIGVNGDGAGGVYFVSYEQESVQALADSLKGLKRKLMIGRVVDVVRAEKRFGNFTQERSFEEVRRTILSNPKAELNLPHGFDHRGYLRWLEKKERKARDSA